MKFWKSTMLAGLIAAGALSHAEPAIKDGGKLAVIGDSITEQKQYSNIIETYILLCSGLKDVQVMQFGWGGERAEIYVRRMEANQKFFPANVATTLYGMNDGRYTAVNQKNSDEYATNSAKIAKFMKDNDVKLFAGSPGAVDTDTFKRVAASVYNNTLNEFGKLGEKAATDNGAQFVNVHKLLIDVMAEAKKQYGDKYHVCGRDGVHPEPNGHLVMAYAFLKALGFDGNIGTIEMDYNEGKAIAGEGHKILSAKKGSAEIESSRYPFCFSAGSQPNHNASILPFLPFNKDLNRFVLVVKNLPAEKATVQYGKAKKSFTKAQLEEGINLADEFIEENPFRENFQQVTRVVGQKQSYETWVGKSYLPANIGSRLPIAKSESKYKGSVELLDETVKAQWNDWDAKTRAAVKPVKYTITVTPEN